MSDAHPTMTRRQLLQAAGKASAVVVASPLVGLAIGEDGAPAAQALPRGLTAVAGSDRVAMLNGRTYLNAWAGYGPRPRRTRGGLAQAEATHDSSIPVAASVAGAEVGFAKQPAARLPVGIPPRKAIM
jgi:cytosine/adenosine deaminase-related metal-dependent hydrolase